MRFIQYTLVVTSLLLAALAVPHSARAQTSVWSWGDNDYGELGIGTGGNGDGADVRLFPVQVNTLAGAVALAAGERRSHALLADGTVWSWGFNQDGSLGIGSTTYVFNSPQQVTGVTGVTAFASGWLHVLTVKNDSTVWTWGNNQFGQLGNGTTNYSGVPIQVPGLTGVTKVAGGYRHSLALKSDGTVWAWGKNDTGQLGNGTQTNSSVPVQVTGLTGVVAIAAGANHGLAVKGDGTVWSWGDSYWGQLGVGIGITPNHPAFRTTPVQVTGLSGITAVAGGYYHSLALKSDGTVWACGYNDYGQLGDGSLTSRNTPVMVKGLQRVTTIAAGMYQSICTRSDGTAWTWGAGYYGQLGDGSYGPNYSGASTYPVKVARAAGFTAVAAGNEHSLAVRDPAFNWYRQVFLQNQADSNIAVLTLRGARFTGSSTTVPMNGANQVVVATGDFNRDGNDDIVVQNSQTGAVTFLYMNGNVVQSTAVLSPALGADWKVMAAADFGQGNIFSIDGWPDLVIQNMATQQVAIVKLDGANIVSTTPLSKSLLPGWKVVGAADFGGAVKPEVVVQNSSTRQISILTLDDDKNVVGSTPLLPTLPVGWTARGVGDFTGDGWPDLMVQNTSTGEIAVLTVVNMQITSSYSISPIPLAGWTLVGPR